MTKMKVSATKQPCCFFCTVSTGPLLCLHPLQQPCSALRLERQAGARPGKSLGETHSVSGRLRQRSGFPFPSLL